MVNDPYKTLGIHEGATQDEIKSAYRKMAKLYHPDLHPDDANAAIKMNEINEAYDMLTHPEKYAKRRAEEQARQSYGGYSGYYRNQSGSQGQRQTGYQGAGGWYSDFNGFDFEDFFNFAGFNTNAYQKRGNINPTVMQGDSPDIAKAVNLINQGRYQEAFKTLMDIPHTGRNARWYYLNALTLYGYGDKNQAVDYMQKAVQLDPNNQTYHSLLQMFRQESQTYYRNTVVVNPFRRIGRIILVIFLIRIFFSFLSMLMMGFGGGGFYPLM